MATERLQLDDEDVADLAVLARNGEKLSAILAKSEELGPRVGTRGMAFAVSRSLGFDFQQVFQAASGLLLIRAMKAGLERNTKAIIKDIASSLKEKAGDDAAEAWNAVKAEITQAVDALDPQHPLMVSYQAGDAADNRQHVVTSMEIFTDTRSVFNETRDQVLFSIIGHTLVFGYYEGFRRHAEIHLSLDAVDLVNLSALCDRALSEANALKKASTVPARTPFDAED